MTISMEVPHEKTREFLQTILLIIKSVRREKGCLECHFYHDMEDENKFRLVGKWERQEDMDTHLRSDAFSVLLGSMNLLQKSPDIRFYVLSCMGSGVEAINMARGKIQEIHCHSK